AWVLPGGGSPQGTKKKKAPADSPQAPQHSSDFRSRSAPYFHFDGSRLGGLFFGKRHGQYAILVFRPYFLGVNRVRQPKIADERPVASLDAVIALVVGLLLEPALSFE